MELEANEQSGTHYTLLNTISKSTERKTPFLVKISDGCHDHPFCYVNVPPVSIDPTADRIQAQIALAVMVALFLTRLIRSRKKNKVRCVEDSW